MTTTATTPSSPSNSSLNNTAAALLWQQQLQSACGVNSVATQALLKQQEDQLRATRLLLQQRQLDELMASGAAGSPPASRSNSFLSSGPVAGLLGLSNVANNQDALSALAAARRASVQSQISANEAAAKVAAEDEGDDEEDDIMDEEYFKSYSSSGSSKDDQGAAKEDADDKAANESFPHKLYRMLYEAEADNLDGIVSFLPSGRGFTIHKPKDFVAEIMPRFFTTRRIASFQRQLNLYGFRRISEGKEKGAYFHKDFVKGKRTRVQKIKRKSTASRPSPTSFAHRFATAPLHFPSVPSAGGLYGGFGTLGATPTMHNATKELLLARYAGAVGQSATAGPSTASLLEMTRKGLLANAANGNAASHQDILRNAAASLLFKHNNTQSQGPF